MSGDQTISMDKKHDELTALLELINPEWAGQDTAALTQPADDLWSSFNFDLPKDSTLLGDYPSYSDISAILPPVEEPTAIDPLDIFAPAALPYPLVAAPSLAGFSASSESPADTTSPHQSAAAAQDDSANFDALSESDSDSAISEEFAPVRRPAAGAKTRATGARGKRAATKPKPYPRISDVVRDAPQKMGDTNKRPSASTELKGSIRSADAIDDDWRPTLEEYQKMSSKEKRQLRNKISARNFRVRRKEYIATLEGEVATRDQQIQVYRDELSTTKSENNELKKEIERLRKAILEGRTNNLFDKAASEAPNPSSVLSQTNTKTRNTRSLAKANRNKDLPATGSRNGFWGGSVLGGGATPVHTTLVPDFDIVSTLSGKPKAPAPLQENMNPLLNSRILPKPLLPSTATLGGFDGFADNNSFTYKTLESYRMQLWQKMAREAGASQARDVSSATSASPSSSTSSSSWHSSPLGLASAQVGGLYFTSQKGSNLAVAKMEDVKVPNPVQAAVAATTVSQTIVGKLSGAFWDAFSPKPAVSVPRTSSTTIDVDKVRKVLEGKAVLRVVDVDSNITQLEEGMKAVSLVSGRKSPALKRVASSSTVDALEEGLKSMNLNQPKNTKECNQCNSVLGIFSQPMRAGHAPGSIATSSHIGRTVAAQH